MISTTKKYYWIHLNLILEDNFFYRNIFYYIHIFYYIYYLNSVNVIQNINIYFFLISPFYLSKTKIQIVKYNIFCYSLARYTYNGNFRKFSYINCNFMLDTCILPSFSFLNIVQPSNARYNLVRSKTYFFKSNFHFNVDNSILKINSYYSYPLTKELINYISLVYYLSTIAIKEIYFNRNYKEKSIIPLTKYNKISNFNISKNNHKSTMYLHFNRVHKTIKFIPQDYSWLFFFIIWPLFLFEIPFFFFLDWIGYTQLVFAVLPFMLFNWFMRYYIHRKWMLNEMIRKNTVPFGSRNNFIDVRQFPILFHQYFDAVLGSNAENEPWEWGYIWCYYPRKGGAYYPW